MNEYLNGCGLGLGLVSKFQKKYNIYIGSILTLMLNANYMKTKRSILYY